MISTVATRPVFLDQPTQTNPTGRVETIAILGLFTLRWLAGILENFGLPMLSELTAIFMLAGLGLLFLHRMRLAQDTALFFTGTLVWFASGLLSLAANPTADPRSTLSLLTLLLLYGLFTNAATTHLRTSGAFTLLYRIMAAFVLVGCALSLLQVLTHTGFVEIGRNTVQRAFGSDVHPVSFAIQIVAAMVALEVIRIKRRGPLDLLHLFLLAAGTIALYLTLARTAWVMGLLIIAIALVLRGSPLRRILITVFITVTGVIFLTSSARFSDLASLPIFLANFSAQDAVFDWRFVDNSVSWRIVNWSIGLTQALEHPLLGFGPGQSANSSYFSLEMHNIFLEVFFEGGIFGLGALLITLAGLVRMHRRLPRTTPQDRNARILTNTFGFTLFLAVTFSTSFVDQLMSFLLYILLITATAIPSQSR